MTTPEQLARALLELATTHADPLPLIEAARILLQPSASLEDSAPDLIRLLKGGTA